MKIKVLVKKVNKNLDFPVQLEKSDWIDLRASETHRFKAPQAGVLKEVKGEKLRDVKFDTYLMPLGVAMKAPDGYEFVLNPRSSLPFGFGVILGNSQGVIDGGPLGYNGNDDEWKAPLIAIRATTINQNERVCQFKLQLSQKATMWQKLKWLFSSGIELVEVDDLPDTENRGGFGSTGKA